MGEIAGTVIGLRSICCICNECKEKVELESALCPSPWRCASSPSRQSRFCIGGDNTVTKGNTGIFFLSMLPLGWMWNIPAGVALEVIKKSQNPRFDFFLPWKEKWRWWIDVPYLVWGGDIAGCRLPSSTEQKALGINNHHTSDLGFMIKYFPVCP